MAQEHSIVSMDEVMSDSLFHNVNERFSGLLSKQNFIQNLIEVQKGEELIKRSENKTTLFFTALLLLFLFAAVRQMMTRHLNNLFGVFFKFQISKRQLHEQLENDRLSSWILTIVYFLSLGYIIFRLAILKSAHLSSYSSPLLLSICILIGIGLFGLKTLFIKMLAWVFQQREAAEQYLFNTSIVNEFASILLFPICIILIIKSGNMDLLFLKVALVLLFITFLFRYIRTFGVAKKFLRLNFVHFLMYLCTFEIMPIMVLVKMITNASF